jgi:hypothetical protein
MGPILFSSLPLGCAGTEQKGPSVQDLPAAFGAAETKSKGQESKDPLLPGGLVLEGEELIEEDIRDPAAAPGEGAGGTVHDVAVAVPVSLASSQQTGAGREGLPAATAGGIIPGEGAEDGSDQVARLKYLLYAAAACIIVLMVVIVALIIVTTSPLFSSPEVGLPGQGVFCWGGGCVPEEVMPKSSAMGTSCSSLALFLLTADSLPSQRGRTRPRCWGRVLSRQLSRLRTSLAPPALPSS